VIFFQLWSEFVVIKHLVSTFLVLIYFDFKLVLYRLSSGTAHLSEFISLEELVEKTTKSCPEGTAIPSELGEVIICT
jgi:hypothetical protein